MAAERPLAPYGALCGSPATPNPDAPCPLCEEALAAGAGPLTAADAATAISLCDERLSSIRPRAAFGRDVFADAPARAPPDA